MTDKMKLNFNLLRRVLAFSIDPSKNTLESFIITYLFRFKEAWKFKTS